MTLTRKEVPEWLRANSTMSATSNFTISKSNNNPSKQSSLKMSRKNSKKSSESNSSKERVPDENELVIHIYLNKLKFEKKNGSLLFMSPIKLFLGYIERQEIPTELICIFDDAGCKYEDGHLLANLYDYRHIVKPDSAEPNPNQARKLFTKMKPTQQSIVEDIKYLSEKAKILITKDEVLELESRLLLFHNPILDLAVDDASIAINNAMMNIKNSKHVEPEKCMKNSSELEEEEAEREEIKRMLMMMKDSPLKNKLMEGLDLLAFIKERGKRKFGSDGNSNPSGELKKPKTTTQSSIPGYTLIRCLNFQSVEGDGGGLSTNDIYMGVGGKYKAILKLRIDPETNIEESSKEVNFDDNKELEAYIKNFLEHYTLNNKLISDSKPIPAEIQPVQKVTKVPGATEASKTLPKSAGNNQVNHPVAAPVGKKNSNSDQPVKKNNGGRRKGSNSAISQSAASKPTSVNIPNAPLIPEITNGTNQGLQPNIQLAQYHQGIQQQLYANTGGIQQGNVPPQQVRPILHPNLGQAAIRPIPQAVPIARLQQHVMKGLINNQQQVPGNPNQMGTGAAMQPNAMYQQNIEAIRQAQILSAQQNSAARPQQNQLVVLTPQQREVLANLQNLVPLTQQQNQVLDSLLQQPNINQHYRNAIINMRVRHDLALKQNQNQNQNQNQGQNQGQSQATNVMADNNVAQIASSIRERSMSTKHQASETPNIPNSQFNSQIEAVAAAQMPINQNGQGGFQNSNVPQPNQTPVQQTPNIAPHPSVPQQHPNQLLAINQQLYNQMQQCALSPQEAAMLQFLQAQSALSPQQLIIRNQLVHKYSLFKKYQQTLLQQQQAIRFKQALNQQQLMNTQNQQNQQGQQSEQTSSNQGINNQISNEGNNGQPIMPNNNATAMHQMSPEEQQAYRFNQYQTIQRQQYLAQVNGQNLIGQGQGINPQMQGIRPGFQMQQAFLAQLQQQGLQGQLSNLNPQQLQSVNYQLALQQQARQAHQAQQMNMRNQAQQMNIGNQAQHMNIGNQGQQMNPMGNPMGNPMNMNGNTDGTPTQMPSHFSQNQNMQNHQNR